MPTPQPRLFVTGASGHLGRRVVELLVKVGANVAAGTRSPEKLADLSELGVDVRHTNFDDPASLDAAFEGVDRLLIISVLDTPEDPPHRLRQHRAAVEAAARAGVKHIVYTSMVDPGPDSPIPFWPDHAGTEQAIEQTGIPFTILRPNWYTDSVFFWLPQALATGQWISAAGDGRIAYVWRDDLAYAAAAALLETGSEKRRLDISGPQALSPQDILATVNEVFESSVELVKVSDEELAAGLEAAGLPAPLVALFTAFDLNTRLGRAAGVSDAVEQLTGQAPRTLRDFLLDNKAALEAARDSPAQ